MIPASFDPNDEATYDGIFGLPANLPDAQLVIVPVPFDATASYRRGAAQGPAAMLEASWQIDLRDLETGDPWKKGITLLDAPAWLHSANESARRAADIVQAADLAPDTASVDRARKQVNDLTTRVTSWVNEQARHLLDEGKSVAIVGGDHASPLGSILAHAQHYPQLGVLHVDAHADLRPAYQGLVHSHASIMHNVLERTPDSVRIVQVGVRDLCEQELDTISSQPDRVRTFFDDELSDAQLEGTSFADLSAKIIDALPANVYVSFDIDGLDPSLCPHTGTPVPGGLSFPQATYLLKRLATSGRTIVGFDLCEVAPGPDGDDLDALVGARLLYKLAGWTLSSR